METATRLETTDLKTRANFSSLPWQPQVAYAPNALRHVATVLPSGVARSHQGIVAPGLRVALITLRGLIVSGIPPGMRLKKQVFNTVQVGVAVIWA